MPPKKSLFWTAPPLVKIFEAFGALADGRITHQPLSSSIRDDAAVVKPESSTLRYDSFWRSVGQLETFSHEFRCVSSGLDKSYTIKIERSLAGDSTSLRVACNDNGSLFQGYLGYPAVAVMIALGLVDGDRNTDADSALSHSEAAEAIATLQGIPWKALAVARKNNWDLVVSDALQTLAPEKAKRVCSVATRLHKSLEVQLGGNRVVRWSGPANKRQRDE